MGILLSLVLFFVLGMLTMTYNTARLSTEKIRLQNAVDAAALEHAAWQARGMNMIQNLNNEGYTALSFAEELICISIFINDVRYGFELIADASKAIPVVGAAISAVFNALEIISYYLIRGVLFAADWFANTIAGKVIYYLQFFCQFTPIIGFVQAQQLARLNGAESIGGKGANFTVGSTTFGVYAIGVSMKSPLTTFKLPVKRAFNSSSSNDTDNASSTNSTDKTTDQTTNKNDKVSNDSVTNGWVVVGGNDINGARADAVSLRQSPVQVSPLVASDKEGVQKLNLIVDANDQSYNLEAGAPSMATAAAIGASVNASQSSSSAGSDTRKLATANRRNVKSANKLDVAVPMSVGSAGMTFNASPDTASSGSASGGSAKAGALDTVKNAVGKVTGGSKKDDDSTGEAPFVTDNKEYQNKLIVGGSKRNSALKGKCPKFNFNPMVSTGIPAPCVWICYKDRAQVKLVPLNVWDRGASSKTKGRDARGDGYKRLTTGHGGIGRTIVLAAAKCVSGDIVKQSVTASGTYCFQRPAGLGAGATAKLVPISTALPAAILQKTIGTVIFH